MFGIDLWDASLLPAMLVAMLGGLISFASPCILPIVPPYLAYMGGISIDEMNSTAHARARDSSFLVLCAWLVHGVHTAWLYRLQLGAVVFVQSRLVCNWCRSDGDDLWGAFLGGDPHQNFRS